MRNFGYNTFPAANLITVPGNIVNLAPGVIITSVVNSYLFAGLQVMLPVISGRVNEIFAAENILDTIRRDSDIWGYLAARARVGARKIWDVINNRGKRIDVVSSELLVQVRLIGCSPIVVSNIYGVSNSQSCDNQSSSYFYKFKDTKPC